jgi:hypothetical protein
VILNKDVHGCAREFNDAGIKVFPTDGSQKVPV